MRVIGGAAMAVTILAGGAQAKTVAVTAGRLLDVKTGKYLEKPLVVIEDGRLASVGKAGDAVPAGAERVDLPGVTLLPGLIDMHVHLTSAAKYGGYRPYDDLVGVSADPLADVTVLEKPVFVMKGGEVVKR